ncbi:hypothetical protein BVC80_1651g17 [Macleaya cordata]|uniref:Uncharacterized protein n=1 Tax=Macleaya cordata TaxID=56857 RepID=A0A200PZ86_MACCD|nr:hypothetical protein BVC80_1651g17 [Macleaya cordata]
MAAQAWNLARGCAVNDDKLQRIGFFIWFQEIHSAGADSETLDHLLQDCRFAKLIGSGFMTFLLRLEFQKYLAEVWVLQLCYKRCAGSGTGSEQLYGGNLENEE